MASTPDVTTGPDINWRELAPGVFTATLHPESVNVGLVVGTDSALLVDVGSSPEQGAELLASATARAGVPVTHAVITHNHWDHWFGLAGMPGVVGIAQENLVGDQPSADTQANARRLGLTDLPQPEQTFSLVRPVNLGGIHVEILHFGGGHTNCDAFVYVPSRNVLFVGDMLEQGGDPQFDETSDVANWPQALDGILGATNDATVFVPGHGDVVDRMFAFVQRAEVGMIHGNSEWLISQGTGLEDAQAAIEWPFSAETMSVALPLAYGQLAAKGIKPRRQLPIQGI